jgi:hypothetical protein
MPGAHLLGAHAVGADAWGAYDIIPFDTNRYNHQVAKLLLLLCVFPAFLRNF